MKMNATQPSQSCSRKAIGIVITSSERYSKGTVLGVDEWEALCKDRSSYSISVLAELNETIITSLSCRELLATSKMLLHRGGSKSKAVGCKIK